MKPSAIITVGICCFAAALLNLTFSVYQLEKRVGRQKEQIDKIGNYLFGEYQVFPNSKFRSTIDTSDYPRGIGPDGYFVFDSGSKIWRQIGGTNIIHPDRLIYPTNTSSIGTEIKP